MGVAGYCHRFLYTIEWQSHDRVPWPQRVQAKCGCFVFVNDVSALKVLHNPRRNEKEFLLQVRADGSLPAVLNGLPLLITVMAQTPAGKTAATSEPRPLGTAEIDLSPLLHARCAHPTKSKREKDQHECLPQPHCGLMGPAML